MLVLLLLKVLAFLGSASVVESWAEGGGTSISSYVELSMLEMSSSVSG